MADRPYVSHFSVWDCERVEVKFDHEHSTVDVTCHGKHEYQTLRLSLWGKNDQIPLLLVDGKLIKAPEREPEDDLTEGQ